MSSDHDRPIGEVLLGLELVPLDAVLLVKTLDAEGDVVWCTRYTRDVSLVERMGALRAALVIEEARVVAAYTPEGGDSP